jgi:hypothetical protein
MPVTRKSNLSDSNLGAITSISAVTIPVLQETLAPSRLPSTWKVLYGRGAARAPAMAAFTALNHAYVAYFKFQNGFDWRGSAVAGLFTAAIVPYTLIFMMVVNGKLTDAARAAEKGKVDTKEVDALLGRWTVLNAVRGLLPLLGGAVGLWSAMNRA